MDRSKGKVSFKHPFVVTSKESICQFGNGILKSYSQVFFSDNRLFAAIILVVSFFDFWAGISGLLAIVVSNLLGYVVGYSRLAVNKGSYGFNSLLVGLGTGLYFQPGIELFVIVFFASMLTFFLGIALEGILGKYGLPFLSIPFLFGMWIIALASPDLNSLGISERGIYIANEMYLIGGKTLVDLYYYFSELQFIYSLKVYFLSLGAIFFQFNVLSGILIAIGLLIYSRIAFTLSLLGFYSAFYFYQLIGADISQLSYTYIGFNFILTSIALGGFYMIPARSTYLWVVLILPVVVLITISANRLFMPFRLPIYSLPFNLVVLVFLYAMKLRLSRRKGMLEVMVQQNSPEKNLYFFRNASARFKELEYLPIALPFFGEWTVSQAHNGIHTHKEAWKYAWDFVIEDENKNQYEGKGNLVTDYYCFDKKVLTPADGIVQEINDGIDDNAVGDVNLNQNWGNSIVIKHTDYLYSQLSHLKAGSIEVSKGDFVRKGQVLAAVGNSGRSPYPHLHFQLQSTPYVGSMTLDYPIGYYITRQGDAFDLQSFKKPQLGDTISNIQSNSLLKKAFHFIPGQKFDFEHVVNGKTEKLHWEVNTDAYNNAYFHCKKSNSFAYFHNDGNVHYFKNFVGDRKSFLFHFYLALFKVQTGFYQDLAIHDELPINQTFGGLRLVVQDFLAPFYFFLATSYRVEYSSLDDELSPGHITLASSIKKTAFGRELDSLEFAIHIDKKGIQKISLTHKGQLKAACTRTL